MTQDREILQISLGSPACHVTAHLLNLEGLAATTTAPQEDGNLAVVPPYCRADVTHGVSEQLRVPRALLIDAPEQIHRFRVPHTQQGEENTLWSTNHPMTTAAAVAWSGKVEPFSIHASPETPWWSSSPRVATSHDNDTWWQSLHDTSRGLAHSEFSRYRVVHPSPTATTVRNEYTASSSNSRHVDWDELGTEEEDEEEEESEMEQRERRHRQRGQWHTGTLAPMQADLEKKWNTILQDAPNETSQENENEHAVIRPEEFLWTDYLAPPLHPRSILSLPTMSGEDAYFPIASGKSMSLWMEEEVLERIRNMLEDCDSCQGCILSTSGFNAFAGLSTQILYYLHDECPSASRIVLSYDNDTKLDVPSSSGSNGIAGSDASRDEIDWRSHLIDSTRRNVNCAVAWSDFVESSHAMLPLSLPGETFPSQFHAAAAAAAALEATTLPFRVRPNADLRIGTNSYYYGSFSGDSAFGTVPNLSLSEFLGIVKPRERLSLLELDVARGVPPEHLWQNLMEGTSVERDRRMRESPHLVGNRRPRDILPGRWMLRTDEGGLLTSFSTSVSTSRAFHSHFALASALRPSKIGNNGPVLTKYVDALMQGMGVRFRPEQSVSTVLNQSVADFTDMGYAAGSYWKSVWGNRPVLAVVGNTTRQYPRLHEMATNLNAALSPRSRGFYNRDVTSGILPEVEDCQESLSSMWDLRDLYQPPEGSGLVPDEQDLDV